jgi:hypothetical protein
MSPTEKYRFAVAAIFSLIGMIGMTRAVIARKFRHAFLPYGGAGENSFVPQWNDRLIAFLANLAFAIAGLAVLIKLLKHS